MKFCVIRHPDIAALGTCAETALDHHRDNGWSRVSDWRSEPSDFHLPDFADATQDLDAPEPDAKQAATAKNKEKQA